LAAFGRFWEEILRGLIKKPAKKLFGVLRGFFSRPKKDSLQLGLIPLYAIPWGMSREIVHLQSSLRRPEKIRFNKPVNFKVRFKLQNQSADNVKEVL